jgi:hypothetical protein
MGAIASGPVHGSPDVINPFLERGNVCRPVAEACPALVEEH